MRISPCGTSSSRALAWSTSVCGTAIVSMPSCTMPMFSKMPVTSQLTQPDTLAICQASGSAVATMPGPIAPWLHSTMPIAAVLTSSSAFMIASVVMKRVMRRMVGGDGAGVLVDDLAHVGVFVAGAREQLHGEDVGVAVDDAAHHQRANLRRGLGEIAPCAARSRRGRARSP